MLTQLAGWDWRLRGVAAADVLAEILPACLDHLMGMHMYVHSMHMYAYSIAGKTSDAAVSRVAVEAHSAKQY